MARRDHHEHVTAFDAVRQSASSLCPGGHVVSNSRFAGPEGLPTVPTRPRLSIVPGAGKAPFLSRRRLQVVLGCLWLLDGALQLQPFMFTSGFAHQVIAPAAVGQPLVVGGAVRWSAAVIATHPAVYDTLIAMVQLGLGVGLLVPRAARIAIVASVMWALGVWYFGEGLGGIAGGSASLLNGAPGAALLYGVLAVAAWPRTRLDEDEGPPPVWTVRVWTLLWVGYGVLNLLPGNDSPRQLAAPIVANVSSSPPPLAAVDRIAAAALHALGSPALPLLVGLMTGVGLLGLVPGRGRRVAVGAGCALAFAAWVVGQSFGQLTSGQATDPNAAPLVILLGLVILSAAPGPDPRWRPTSPGVQRPSLIVRRQVERGTIGTA
jgi:hypothetical protein